MTLPTDTVSVEQKEPVEPVAEVKNEPVQQPIQEDPVEQTEERQVPLSALQKERRKRQEIEQELESYRARVNTPAPQQEDESEYETVTKKDLKKRDYELIRSVEERNWIKNNPEKAEVIHEKLKEFLKQRPNLTSAIEAASNRYEEAWDLLDKLTPKQKKALSTSSVVKKEAPNAPTGIPKAASMNQSIDVMTMSDVEFNQWRASQRKSR
jgi:hypothetical protein